MTAFGYAEDPTSTCTLQLYVVTSISTPRSTANAVGAPPTLARSRPQHQLRYHGGGSSTAQHASTSRCGNPHVNTGQQGTECSCGPAPPNTVHMNFGSSRRALNGCCHGARAQCMRACCAGISCLARSTSSSKGAPSNKLAKIFYIFMVRGAHCRLLFHPQHRLLCTTSTRDSHDESSPPLQFRHSLHVPSGQAEVATASKRKATGMSLADVGELEKLLLQSHVTFTPTPALSRHFLCE